MSAKEELKSAIKSYVGFDSEIKQLQTRIKQLKEQQKTASVALMSTMRENSIDCFDINNGSIMYKRNKVKKTIGKKFLMETLDKYFQGDREKVDTLNNFIHTNREEVIKE